MLMAEGMDFKDPVSEVVRPIGEFLRSVPGRGTSVAVGRSQRAASLATWAPRSILLSHRRRRAGGADARCVGFGPLLDVIQDPLHDGRILDAGNHLT